MELSEPDKETFDRSTRNDVVEFAVIKIEETSAFCTVASPESADVRVKTTAEFVRRDQAKVMRNVEAMPDSSRVC